MQEAIEVHSAMAQLSYEADTLLQQQEQQQQDKPVKVSWGKNHKKNNHKTDSFPSYLAHLVGSNSSSSLSTTTTTTTTMAHSFLLLSQTEAKSALGLQHVLKHYKVLREEGPHPLMTLSTLQQQHKQPTTTTKLMTNHHHHHCLPWQQQMSPQQIT